MDQFLADKKATLGPVFNSTAYIYNIRYLLTFIHVYTFTYRER